MPEPCRSCPRKTVDFGGCRCQAFLIAGDAGVTDPVCSLSPHRHLVDDAVAEVERTAAAEAGEWVYRAAPNSRRSEEHTSELQSRLHLVCRLLLEKKKYCRGQRAG